MSKYMDKQVKSVTRIPGGFSITEINGKKLDVIYQNGMKASEVEVRRYVNGKPRKVKVEPHSRGGCVYTFNRDITGSAEGSTQNKVPIGRLILEAEAKLAGTYDPDCEYNHKLRVADFRDLDEPERVGTRFGELTSQTKNKCHDTLVTRVLEDTGLIISVSAVSQAFNLLTLDVIKVSDVLSYKHIKHTSPTGKDWYEILV